MNGFGHHNISPEIIKLIKEEIVKTKDNIVILTDRHNINLNNQKILMTEKYNELAKLDIEIPKQTMLIVDAINNNKSEKQIKKLQDAFREMIIERNNLFVKHVGGLTNAQVRKTSEMTQTEYKHLSDKKKKKLIKQEKSKDKNVKLKKLNDLADLADLKKMIEER